MLEIIFIGLCSESTKSQSTQLFYSSFVQIIITFIIIITLLLLIYLFVYNKVRRGFHYFVGSYRYSLGTLMPYLPRCLILN